MNEGIKTKAEKVFKKTFKDDNLEIYPEMTANDVSKWDSLSHMTLISNIEKEFKTKFSFKEVVGMKNVGDLLHLLEKKAPQ